jgi:hypothetical protein
MNGKLRWEAIRFELTRVVSEPGALVISSGVLVANTILMALTDLALGFLNSAFFMLLGYQVAGRFVGANNESCEYLLSKPFSRRDILNAKLATVFLLVATIVLILSAIQFVAAPSKSTYRISGYANVQRMEENTRLTKSYFDLLQQEYKQTKRSKIAQLIEKGRLTEANEVHYTEKFGWNGRYDLTLIFDYFLMLWCALSASICYKARSNVSLLEKVHSSLSDPRLYILISPLLFYLVLPLLGLLIFKTGQGYSVLLSFYLGYFEIFVIVALLWILVLIIMLRKNYSELSF